MAKDKKISECAGYLIEIAELDSPKPGSAAYRRLRRLERQFKDCFLQVESCFCGGRGILINKALKFARVGDMKGAKNVAVAAFKTFTWDAQKVFSKFL